MDYLTCVRKNKGMNDPECRTLAKNYLSCRMDKCVCMGRRLRGGDAW